jgi:hypothetical protein
MSGDGKLMPADVVTRFNHLSAKRKTPIDAARCVEDRATRMGSTAWPPPEPEATISGNGERLTCATPAGAGAWGDPARNTFGCVTGNMAPSRLAGSSKMSSESSSISPV